MCAIKEKYNQADKSHIIDEVIPIAGEYTSSHGRGLDPVLTRLKGSASSSDAEKEGVRVELSGGRYPDKRGGVLQKAIIEFECDAERTGLEGVEGGTGKKGKDEDEKEKDEIEGERSVNASKEDKDKDKEDDGDDEQKEDKSSLKLISYRREGEADREMQVLRLTWRTKYACEGQKGHEDEDTNPSKSSHWGFFTWFLIM